MGRTYAGVLGPLAFLTLITRGFIDGGGLAGTMKVACFSLFTFAALGYLAGQIAAWAVTRSAEERFNAELRTAKASKEG